MKEISDKLKILLIEDDPQGTLLVQRMLAEVEDAPFDLECVDHLSVGLERLAVGDIDMILLDLSLPDSQGFDTFARAHAQTPDVPIIVLSGLDDEKLAVQTMREGAQDYLVKGRTDADLLVRAIRYAIERKQAEKALRESEERFRTLFESIPIGIYHTTPDGRILMTNPAAIQMLGHGSFDELAALDLEKESYQIGYARREFRERIERDGEIRGLETVWRRKDGSEIYVRENARAIRDVDGTVLYYEGTLEDITERKQVEEELRKYRDHLEKLVEERTAHLALLNDIGGKIAAVLELDSVLDRAAHLVQESFGYHHVALFTLDREQGELVMRARAGKFVNLFPSEHRLKLGQGLVGWVGLYGERLLANDVDAEPRYVNLYPDVIPTRSELSVPIRLREEIVGVLDAQSPQLNAFDENDVMVMETLADQIAVAIENAQLHGAVQRELTERKQAEEALRESEEKYRNLVERALDGICIIQDTIVKYANPRLVEMWGGTVEEIIDTPFTSYVHPDELLKAVDRYERRMAGEDVIPVYETALRRKDGSKVYVELNAGIIMYQGKPANLVVVRDVTERKWAEGALQRQLEELIILHAVATIAAEATDEDELIERATQIAGKTLYTDHFGVLLLDEAAGVLRPHPSYWAREEIEGTTMPLGHGIAGQVMADGQPRFVSDVTGEPGSLTIDPLTRSALCAPLKAGELVLGTVNAESMRPDAFSEADKRLLTTFAGQLATAIEKVRLMETLEQRVDDRTRELSALYEVTAVANESLDLETTLERSLERVLTAMKSNEGTIHLLDESGEMLHLAVQQGVPPHIAAQMELMPLGEGLAGWVTAHGEPLVVPDVASDPRALKIAHPTGPHAYVGVPLRAGGRTLGMLSVVGEAGRQFSAEEVALLASIAEHVGVAVEGARLRQRAEQAAVMEERERLARELHDSVTQLLYSLTLLAEGGRRLVTSGILEGIEDYLADLGEIAQQALREMRLLVYQLRPSVLEQEGLVRALRQRLDTVERRAGVEARLLTEGPVELPALVEQELYQITQEALNNALKHAAATSVIVRLCVHGEQILLEVEDDGIGFDPDAVSDTGGLGLLNMRERTEKLGGTLQVVSAPGEGTRVKVSLGIHRNS